MRNIILKQKQVLFFIIAGGLSAIFEVGSFKLFSLSIPKIFPSEVDFHGIHYPYSNVLSTLMGIFSNYFFSIWFVFERGKHSKKKEFTYFMLVSILSTLLSLSFFQLFYRYVFFGDVDLEIIVVSREMLSKISAIILVSLLSYSVKKKLVFNG